MLAPTLSIKVDVDTERGTRIGVPNLIKLFKELAIPATFLFSLGPDNTGRALKRIFRPGFFAKVKRTRVISSYGFQTLLNGILWPGPHIGRRHAQIMRQTQAVGYEVGIHCYDHTRWQDGLAKMSAQQVQHEFAKAQQEFQRIFDRPAATAGAAGWQANAYSLAAYDQAQLLYGSDSRGTEPFFPRIGTQVFNTLQIPTTLPTLDELLGLPEYPETSIADYYLSLLVPGVYHVLTIHAELEGMVKQSLFKELLLKALEHSVRFITLADKANELLQQRGQIPICELSQGTVSGRSGTLAIQT